MSSGETIEIELTDPQAAILAPMKTVTYGWAVRVVGRLPEWDFLHIILMQLFLM